MRASAIVLAHGAEPTLAQCVAALVADGATDIVVVDNDAAPGPVEAVRSMAGVRVLAPGRNLGFAGGCNYAASHATGDVLVFVNSDAEVRPGALDALVCVGSTTRASAWHRRASGWPMTPGGSTARATLSTT